MRSLVSFLLCLPLKKKVGDLSPNSTQVAHCLCVLYWRTGQCGVVVGSAHLRRRYNVFRYPGTLIYHSRRSAACTRWLLS
jgi:hypothetical protein